MNRFYRITLSTTLLWVTYLLTSCIFGASGTAITPTSQGVARQQLGAGVNIGATNTVPAGKLSVANGYMIGTTNGLTTSLDLLMAGGTTNRLVFVGGILVSASNPPPVVSITTPTEWWTMDALTRNQTGVIQSLQLIGPVGQYTNRTGIKGLAVDMPKWDSTDYYTDTIPEIAHMTNFGWSLSYWLMLDEPLEYGLPAELYYYQSLTPGDILIEHYNGVFRVSVGGLDGNGQNIDEDIVINNYAPTTNTWHHLVTVFDAATGFLSFYQDAVLLGSTTNAVQLPTMDEPNLSFTHSLGYTGGALDEIGIWCDHALTTNEINYLYNSGSGRTYPF